MTFKNRKISPSQLNQRQALSKEVPLAEKWTCKLWDAMNILVSVYTGVFLCKDQQAIHSRAMYLKVYGFVFIVDIGF